jgi:hypothetical protein
MLSLNLLNKVKKLSQKSYRPKTFAHSNKSQKRNFSVTFSLITFSHNFLQLFQSASHFLFLIPVLQFWDNFLGGSYEHFWQSLKATAGKNGKLFL